MSQKIPRVLVITQDVDFKRLVENFMRHERIQAAVSSNVLHAAHFLQANLLPDVVLLDLTMPDDQPIAFLKQLRSRPEYAKLPVLVLVDVPDPDTVRTALQAGANRYLTKLFAGKNLLSTLLEMTTEKPPVPGATAMLRRNTATLGGKG